MYPYPFYERGVRSYDEVRQYLATWLSADNVLDKNEPIYFRGKLHHPVARFRRAFTPHIALFEPVEGKYIFVTVVDNGKDDTLHPMSEYQNTYEAMIDDAIRQYCRLWSIECCEW